MKERELSSIVNQIQELLLKCSTVVCDSDLMEGAGERHGFYFVKVMSKKYPSGFYWAVRYKDPDAPDDIPEQKKWFTTKTATRTDNKTEAIAFAIENKARIIEKYKAKRAKRQAKKGGEEFYKMLLEYYTPGSKYLQDDAVNNKRAITVKLGRDNVNFIKKYLEPYLRGKGVVSINCVSRSVYSDLKIHLKTTGISTKTINTYLNSFNRILQYHERNDLLGKLPYSAGNGLIRLTSEDKAKARKPGLLPTDLLGGVVPFMMSRCELKNGINQRKNKPDVIGSALMAALGLTMGLRDSEVGRIKVCDIKRLKDIPGAFYIKIWNNKTKHFNTEAGGEYRMMPLHPLMAAMIRQYVKNKGKKSGDYLFGKPRTNNDTGLMDGHLGAKWYGNAITELYECLKGRDGLKTGNVAEAFDVKIGPKALSSLRKEMTQKNIVFYSLRHTFQTLLGTKYKGQTLLIDYYMGHKPRQAMLANYLHINEMEPKDFWREWGRLLIDFQDQFFTHPDNDARLEYFRKTLEEYERIHGDVVDGPVVWSDPKTYEHAAKTMAIPFYTDLYRKALERANADEHGEDREEDVFDVV